MTKEISKIPEIFPNKSIGVAAVFTHNGRSYGIPLQAEDQNKFEAIIDANGHPIDYDYLRNKKIGLAGGKVEDEESLNDALVRELTSELAESLNITEERVRTEIIPFLSWSEPKKVENISILQAVQNDRNGENIPRGVFDIYVSSVELSDELFSRLETILRPLDASNPKDLRPFIKTII